MGGRPDTHPRGVRAIEHSESLVLEAADIEGVVLRYGTFYGPNTWYSTAPGASNAKVKSEIGWTPEYSTWRRGFQEAIA